MPKHNLTVVLSSAIDSFLRTRVSSTYNVNLVVILVYSPYKVPKNKYIFYNNNNKRAKFYKNSISVDASPNSLFIDTTVAYGLLRRNTLKTQN